MIHLIIVMRKHNLTNRKTTTKTIAKTKTKTKTMTKTNTNTKTFREHLHRAILTFETCNAQSDEYMI